MLTIKKKKINNLFDPLTYIMLTIKKKKSTFLTPNLRVKVTICFFLYMHFFFNQYSNANMYKCPEFNPVITKNNQQIVSLLRLIDCWAFDVQRQI